ncbi:Asp23/Gls24 family envelope stress response protein [Clostridiales bacterium COT073_COT-073]|nr:Asp23/Gls24 family envelope stress response protein [Clostridiales bacterium COT073_COT-073]
MERRILKINDQHEGGTVNIADEVIAVIAGMAAAEVEGVVGMVGKLHGELVELLGMKNLGKGIKVRVNEAEEITLDLAVIIEADVSVQEVTARIQQKVKSTVENMTGLTVAAVNIKVSGVEVKAKDKKEKKTVEK